MVTTPGVNGRGLYSRAIPKSATRALVDIVRELYLEEDTKLEDSLGGEQ
jgi:hypothetical protein